MIEFKTISMRNFLSYGNNVTVIQLERPGTTLVLGEDLDNTSDGKGANGVGKSTIVNAIAFALYDKTISDISKDNLVNNINKKNMEVVLDFTVNKKNYRIVRQRKMKDPSNVFLFIEGEDKTPDSAAATNLLIEQILGMPYELFVRIIVFSASHKPFLDLPVRHASQTNQTDFIEELFSLTNLSRKAELLKLMIKDTERELAGEKSRISQSEQEHARHQTQIDSTKKRVVTWEVSNEETINTLKEKLEKYATIDVPQQQSLLLTQAEIDDVLTNTLDEQRSQEREKRDLSKQLEKALAEIKHLADSKCPYCLQDFLGARQKLKSVNDTVTTITAALNANSVVAERLIKEISVLSKKHKEVKSSIVVGSLEELMGIDIQQANIKARIEELVQAVNPFLDPLDELLNTDLPPIDYDKANTLDKTLEHQKFLLKLLTRKDSFVRKELLDKNIPYLNACLQHHLAFLGLPHKVEFTHEMTASISQFGRSLDFGNLSAGQRARVNLALSLAFRDVLQQLHQRINICMFDEVLDTGLDTVGTLAAAQLLKKITKDEGISSYIISHKSEFEGVFDNTMTIQLTKGFSYVKET